MKNANGFGSISKLSGKRRKPYMVRKTVGFDENGKQKYYIIGYFAKKAEALEALVEYNKRGIVNTDYSFSDVYKAFTEEKYLSLGKSIPPTYSIAYKRTEPLYKLSFNTLRLIHFENIMNTLPSYNTKRDLKVLLQQMYKYALRHDIVDKNIAQNLIVPQAPKSDIHVPFTDEEMKILWQNKDKFEAKLYLIYCYTGLRPSELILIETEKVFLDEKYMIGGIKNEYSIDRDIPLADCILPIIQSFYNPSNKYLITYKNKELPYFSLHRKLESFCNKNKLNHHPHDGRHTCATKLAEVGVPLNIIQNILGHSGDSITTKVYIHKNLNIMLDAVNKLPSYQC